jgi:hypothetical protein
MKETQSRRQEGDDRGGLVDILCEGRGSAGLVVILQKARQFVLVVEPRTEVIADRPSVMLAQTIIESLVVGVVETYLISASDTNPTHASSCFSAGRHSRR